MVRVALRELAEEGGSTEASISGYIRSNYTQLPPGHSRLLPYYLGKLVAAGDVSMLSPNRFALPLALPPPPPPPPPTWSHHSPIPNPGPRRSSSAPRIPRRRGRPPKRKRTSASGSAVSLMLPPWPRSPHHATDANAPPPPRRGRGRPRKNPENAVHSGAKAPCAAEPAARPRLIVRLRSRPPNPIPDTVAGDDASGTTTTTAQAIGKRRSGDGMAQKPDGKPSSANANIEEESALLALVQPEPAPLRIKEEDALPPPASALAAALQLELKGALLPSALPIASWQKAEPDEEPAPPSLPLPETNETLWPLVPLHSEPDVEMLLLDQMQPEPEGGLLLLRPDPEPEPLPLARKQPGSNEERSLLTPLHPATMRPESKEESSPPVAQPDAWSVASPAKPEEEPLAPGQLQLEAKEPKGETLSLECDESYFASVSVDPEPCKELVLLDATQPNLEEEFLQLLPLQSDTELELLSLPAPTQSELHGEPILSISTQPEPGEQLAIELTEVSPHLQLCKQSEPTEGFSHHPEPDEGSFPTLMQIEPGEELLPLAAIEPEGKERSSPPASVPAVEMGEKNEHSSKQRRTHVKHRRLWFEC